METPGERKNESEILFATVHMHHIATIDRPSPTDKRWLLVDQSYHMVIIYIVRIVRRYGMYIREKLNSLCKINGHLSMLLLCEEH